MCKDGGGGLDHADVIGSFYGIAGIRFDYGIADRITSDAPLPGEQGFVQTEWIVNTDLIYIQGWGSKPIDLLKI